MERLRVCIDAEELDGQDAVEVARRNGAEREQKDWTVRVRR